MFRPEKGLDAQQIAARVDAVLTEATLAEKVGMMSGKGFFRAFREDGGLWAGRPYRAGGGIERLEIPPFYFSDGPRGVARGNSTCFPCTMARGASFDTDLEYRIGEVMSIELRAQGCSLSGAVCINLLRHPAWGRAQETYGEDPYHLGAMGAALGRGLQTHNVCATVKHYALNSMENARFVVDVEIDERSLHEIYLPHFKTVLDAGVASVMSAYNRMNGEYCGQHRHLLTDILRGEWGFGGFVHSDWVNGVYKIYGASAGLDVENPEPLVFGDKLIAAVEAGTVEPQVIDIACRRILTTFYRFACAEDPLPEYPIQLVANAAHIAVAREAAEKSAVLLRNAAILPLDSVSCRKIAVLGRLAAVENTGDNGSSRVRPRYVVTPLQGLRAMLGEASVTHADEADLGAVQTAIVGVDAIVVVVGYTAEEEGEYIPGDIALGQENSLEPDADHVPDAIKQARKGRPRAIGGDRVDLGLPDPQIALIETAAASGKPVIVVIVAGSAVLVEAWHEKVGAILQTFYSGMEGGTALARVLFGQVSPSGRLPFTVARDAADYPFFDREAKAIRYDYWHGYAKLARDGVAARYPFGHGLSYAQFSYHALTARRAGAVIEASVAVRNDGAVTADHVVLLWAEPPGGIQPMWPRRLVAFARLSLAPGQTKLARFDVVTAALRYRDPVMHDWKLESGAWRFVTAETAEAEGGPSVTLVF